MSFGNNESFFHMDKGTAITVFKVVDGELTSAADYSKQKGVPGAYLYYDSNGHLRKLTRPKSYADLAKIGWYRVTYMNEMPSYDNATEYIETQYEIVDNFIQVTYVKKTLEV